MFALVTAELSGDFAAAEAQACAGACAVVVVVSQPGATALAMSVGTGLGLELDALTAAATLGAAEGDADGLALGAAEAVFDAAVGDAEVAVVIAGTEGDGCADWLGLAAAAAGEGLAAGDAAAVALAVGAELGVDAGALDATFDDDKTVAALFPLGADGWAKGAVSGARDGVTTRGEAVAEMPGLGAASGDAEVAGLVALAAGEDCGDALGLGVMAAIGLAEADGEARALAGAIGLPDGLAVGLSAASGAAQLVAWVVLSSPLPKMFACTAAAAVETDKRITTAMTAERDRLPRLGPSARSS